MSEAASDLMATAHQDQPPLCGTSSPSATRLVVAGCRSPVDALAHRTCRHPITYPTFSASQTSFCTIRSILSNSAHFSGQVPTGVIASARLRGRSGSARKPLAIALARSCSRFFLSCCVCQMCPYLDNLGVGGRRQGKTRTVWYRS